MSWALFWFLVALLLLVMLQRTMSKNQEMQTELSMLRDKYIARNRAYRRALDNITQITSNVAKAKQVIYKMQRGLAKYRVLHNTARNELAFITKERDRLREEIEEKNKKRSFHMS